MQSLASISLDCSIASVQLHSDLHSAVVKDHTHIPYIALKMSHDDFNFRGFKCMTQKVDIGLRKVTNINTFILTVRLYFDTA